MHSEYNIEKIKTKAGINTIRINGYLLGSKYHPILEAEKFVHNHYKPNHVHILFGYGTGIIPKEFLKKFTENDKLIVFEPILESLDELELNTNILVVNKEDTLKLKLLIDQNIDITDKITVICSPNYEKICPELYKNFLSDLKNILMQNKINENTILDMSESWQRNYLLNLKYIVKDYSLKKLENFTTSPVVIVSGGPSLTKQIPLLKKYRRNLILIAAGSTINTLMKFSVEPDFIVSIDGHEINYNHFKDLKLNNAKFIYSIYSYFSIRNVFNNPSYYFLNSSSDEIATHLDKIVNQELVDLVGGGSVAHYALSVATFISTGPVAIIGQDLAYTNNQSHADANKGLKTISREDIIKKDLFYTKGYFEDEVLTDYSFMSMKNSFEQLIKRYNESVQIYNCTEGGARIEGYSQIPFSSFCEQFACDNISSQLTHDLEGDNPEHSENLLATLERELIIYDKLKLILIDNLSLLSKNKSSISFEKSILDKLDKNDILIEKYRKQTALSISMDPINIIILKNFKPTLLETENEAYIRIKNQNKTLYKEYIRAVNNAKVYTKLAIENLKKELVGVNFE